jgi:hypothetical protein
VQAYKAFRTGKAFLCGAQNDDGTCSSLATTANSAFAVAMAASEL